MTETTGYSGAGPVHIKNLHLDSMKEDVLYHLGLGMKTQDLPAAFGDFVCVGGSPSRMRAFAHVMQEELVLAGGRRALADRCATYRARPLLSVSHGMGIPSISIMLHELIKLLHHTRCRDVTIIRIGTSGGLGIEAGSVVITDTAVDSSFKPRFEEVVLDDMVVRTTELDKDLAVELLSWSKEISDFPTLTGHTMCTYDFYKGKFGKFSNVTCKASTAAAVGESRVKIWHRWLPKTIQVPRGPLLPLVRPFHGNHVQLHTLQSGSPGAAPWQRKQPLVQSPVADGLHGVVSYKNNLRTTKL